MSTSHTETYLVSDIGTCLFLKLCGFVEAHHAKIRDVSENHLRLRFGGSWWEQLLDASLAEPALDLEILFVSAETHSENHPQAWIQVIVRDRRLIPRPDRFEAAARRVLFQLRSHLMVQ